MSADRIDSVEAVTFSTGAIDRLVVLVATEAGHTGVGEAGLTGRELAVAGAVAHLADLVVGQEAGRIEHLWQTMFRGGFFPAGSATAAALSAVDIALWDIRGKTFDVPVYELLGGATRDKVVCYPHNTQADNDVDTLLDSCRQTVAAGWRFVRWGLPLDGDGINPGRSVRLCLEQLAAVRETVGPDIDICIDLHTRLDPADALTFCRAAEVHRPFFIEDPVRVENPNAMRRLRQLTGVPLAAGEQLNSKWQFKPLIDEHLIDYARIDVGLAGGITEAKKIAAMCEAAYINLALHNPLGPATTAASLHVNLSSPNVGVQEQPLVPGSDPATAEIFPVQMTWKDGYLLAPDRPGLGVEFDVAAARRSPPKRIGLPLIHRADGSLSNW